MKVMYQLFHRAFAIMVHNYGLLLWPANRCLLSLCIPLIKAPTPAGWEMSSGILRPDELSEQRIIPANYTPTAIKFTLQVHLTSLHQLADSSPVWLIFRDHRGQNVNIKFMGSYGDTNNDPCMSTLIILCARNY